MWKVHSPIASIFVTVVVELFRRKDNPATSLTEIININFMHFVAMEDHFDKILVVERCLWNYRLSSPIVDLPFLQTPYFNIN